MGPKSNDSQAKVGDRSQRRMTPEQAATLESPEPFKPRRHRAERFLARSALLLQPVTKFKRLTSKISVPAHPGRSLVGLSATLMVSQIIMAITGLLTARWLGPSGKGLVAAATTWGQLLGWLAGLGVAVAIQVRLAETPNERKAAATSAALGNGLLFSAVFGTSIGLAAFFPLVRTLAHLGVDSTTAVALTILPLPVAVFASILAYVQLALGHNRRYSMSLAVGPITTLALVLALGWAGQLSPIALLICYLAGSVVSLVISAGQLPWKSIHLDAPLLRRDIIFGGKTWLSGSIGLANLRLDLLVMSAFLSAHEIGIYSAANNLMMPVSSMPAAIALMIAPKAARLHALAGSRNGIAAIWAGSRQAFILAIFGGAILAVMAPLVIPILLGEPYRPVIIIVWILITGSVARSVMVVIVSGANGMRRLSAGYISEGIGLATTFALLPFLLTKWGIIGAAITSTVSYSFSGMAAGYWLLKARKAGGPPVSPGPLAPVTWKAAP